MRKTATPKGQASVAAHRSPAQQEKAARLGPSIGLSPPMRGTGAVSSDARGECLVARGYVQALQCTVDHFEALGVDASHTELWRRQLRQVAAQLDEISDLVSTTDSVLELPV